MALYRERFQVIQAEQFDAVEAKKTGDFPTGFHPWPDDNKVTPRDMSHGYVQSRTGRVHVQHLDWIIEDEDGVHYRTQGPVAFARAWEYVQGQD